MPSKAIDGAKRGDLFRISPFKLVIAGLDRKVEPDHKLWVPARRIANLRDDGMAENILVNGMIQPIPVAPLDGEWWVIAGRRRTFNGRLAAEMHAKRFPDAKPFEVPVIVRELSDAMTRNWIASENSQRRADEVVEQAQLALNMCEGYGMSHDDVAVQFGVDANTVRHWLKIARASQPVLDAVNAGRVSPKAAAALADLPRADQKTELEKLLAAAPEGKVVSAPAAKAAARNAKARATGKAESDPRPGLREIKRMIRHCDEKELLISQDRLDMLKWFVGAMADREIRGMTELRRKASGG